jgi:hypothetical protein
MKVDYELLVSKTASPEEWRAEMEKDRTLRDALGSVEFLRLLTNREDGVCQPDTDHARRCQFHLAVTTPARARAVHLGVVTVNDLLVRDELDEPGRVFNVVRSFRIG